MSHSCFLCQANAADLMLLCNNIGLFVSLQVAQEIWVCEKQTITKWNRDILAYKEHLKSKIDKQMHDL